MKFYSLQKLIQVFQDYDNNSVADRFFISDVEVEALINKALFKEFDEKNNKR